MHSILFAIYATGSTIALTVHSVLTVEIKKDTYDRMLFMDYSSALNTGLPANLINMLKA